MTSLIEQLGGYEKAKECLDTKTARLSVINELRAALLEYRRKHNIFEAGDKVVVKSKPIFSDDYKIHIVKDEYLDDPCMGAVRHATDKEIVQGYRDE